MLSFYVCSRSPVTDSDEEDSAESSTDDEAMEENVQEMPEDRSVFPLYIAGNPC